MTTQRRTTVVASNLAVLALALLVGGCGSIFDTNEAACRRVINRTLSCASTLVNVPLGTSLDFSQGCATVPETSDCDDWRALADCVTSVDCPEFTTPDSEALSGCEDIQDRLEINGCFATGFGT